MPLVSAGEAKAVDAACVCRVAVEARDKALTAVMGYLTVEMVNDPFSLKQTSLSTARFCIVAKTMDKQDIYPSSSFHLRPLTN